MSRKRDIIAKALQPGDSGFLDRYRGREIEFYKERGRVYPEKLEEIFQAIAEMRYGDLVVIGPRGGGKTMVVYDAAGKRFLWDGDDVFGIGGSDSQARNGYAYVRQVIAAEKALKDGLQDDLKTCATGPTGNWFKVAPSSSKQVRGPHPGDPHEGTGWQAHGGILIKDERDEMDDEIAGAADASMGAADPSMVITTSTMHRADGGGIAQLAEEAELRGAKVIKFDIFDVSQTCEHDCAACPGGRKFAGPLWGVKSQIPNAKAQRGEGAKGGGKTCVPMPTRESLQGWEKFKRESGFPMDESGYCEGRAKMHRPGHVKMSEIFKASKRALNDESFEVEFCCRSRRGARYVVDRAALDRCLREDVYFEQRYETPIITIDWGFVGWCVPILLQRQAEHKIAVLDVRYEHMAPIDRIVAICMDWQRAYGAYQVCADGSHPYENNSLAQAGFEVHPVPFVSQKERGAGWIKGIVERGQLMVRGRLHGQTQTDTDRHGQTRMDTDEGGQVGASKATREFFSSAEEELFKQIRNWKRDDKGKIVKKNDHGPDSLSCAAELFAEEDPFEVDFVSAGLRPSFGFGGAM